MEKLLLIVIATLCFLPTYSQNSKSKKQKEELTIEVKYNGITHTIKNGDTVHLGYGSLPNGDFMYIGNSSPRVSMGKEYARKTGTITKVKYWKSLDQYQITIKGKFGFYIVDIPQAIEKEEVIGFNETFFKQ